MIKKQEFQKFHLKLPNNIVTVQMEAIVKKKTGTYVCCGSVFNLEPFYIEEPSEREKESCFCIFCGKLRLRF